MKPKGKRVVRRHSVEFRRAIVARLRAGESFTKVSKETGIHRVLLYHWYNNPEHPFQKKAEGTVAEPLPARKLGRKGEMRELKRLLAEKTLEVDFFKGALQKVEARRQRNANTGATTSTPKSGK